MTNSSSGTGRSKVEAGAEAGTGPAATPAAPATLDSLLDKLNPAAKAAIINGILASLTGAAPIPKPLTADTLEEESEYDVVLRPGRFVTLMKSDPLTMFMTGAMNSSLQQAVDRAHSRLESIAQSDDPLKVFDMTQDEKDETMQVMREYAVAVVIHPKFTMDKARNPELADVTKLSLQELMTIFNAVPNGVRYPRLQGVQADTFRPIGVSEVVEAAPAEPDVPLSAIRLARVNGREVETISA